MVITQSRIKILMEKSIEYFFSKNATNLAKKFN